MLDLEGNDVEDLGQMRYLQLCPRLATLTLEGNLVCLKPDAGPSKVCVQNTQSAYVWEGPHRLETSVPTCTFCLVLCELYLFCHWRPKQPWKYQGPLQQVNPYAPHKGHTCSKLTVYLNSCLLVLIHDQLHTLEGFPEPWLWVWRGRAHTLRG